MSRWPTILKYVLIGWIVGAVVHVFLIGSILGVTFGAQYHDVPVGTAVGIVSGLLLGLARTRVEAQE
ncbi:MAG: hypothetical protein ACYCPT_14065 [Acidimicrobiales bacterium]